MSSDTESAAQAAPRTRALTVRTKKEHEEGEEEKNKAENSGDVEITTTSPEVDKEEEQPLSPAGRLFHEPNTNCYIVAMMGVDCPIDVGVIREGLEATLVRHPRFSSALVSEGGKKRWVHKTVDLNHHVIVPDLCLNKSPTNSTSPADKIVEDYVASLSNGPGLDLSRPLWDLHVLNVPTTTASATAVLRMHHSLGDGVSIMSLLLACTRKTLDPESLPTRPQSHRRTKSLPSFRPLAMLLTLWALVVLTWNSLVDIALFFATTLFLKDTRTPFMGSKGVEHRPKRFVFRLVSLDDIKDIKNAVNCTVNDVLVGVASAGLSRYLKRKSDEFSTTKNKSFPKNIKIRSIVLVNLRSTPGIQELAEKMDKDKVAEARWGNYFGYVLLPFPIVTHGDPLEYVRQGKSIADRKKNSLEALFSYYAALFIVKLFGIKAAAVLCYRVFCHSTFSFSNVVGPVEEISFYGHPLLYIAPSVYGHPHALTLHFLSFVNKMVMVLAVDELAIPDPHQLLDDFAESLRLMKDAADEKS